MDKLGAMDKVTFRAKYEVVADHLRSQIQSGTMAAGVKLDSEPELAACLKVSRETVRRALGILEQQRLLSRRQGKGTFVRDLARQSQRRLRIGLLGLSPLADDPSYLSPLLVGLQESLNGGSGIELSYLPQPGNSLSAQCLEYALDGFVGYNPSLELAGQLVDPFFDEIPHVIVAASFPLLRRHNRLFADTDNRGAAMAAVRHLAGLGHRRIAFLGDPMPTCNLLDRREGYRLAMTELGLEVVESLGAARDRDWRTVLPSLVTDVLSRPKPPTALFAGSVRFAFATMDAARLLKLRIPDDLSLVAFDDPEALVHLTPPLDTIRQPVTELGRTAGRMLLDQLTAGRTTPRQVILDNQLIIRESSAPPRVRSETRKRNMTKRPDKGG